MSGECEYCGNHTLECNCLSQYAWKPLSRCQENGLEDGIDPTSEKIPTKHIDVNGREEHEALIKNASKCKELGLDQIYETIVYLKRWGGWLGE